ncbi:hypothetical protein EV182_005003, partial [Spiromyces aspiralis]
MTGLELDNLRVVDLKKELQERGLPTNGLKAELRARLEEALKGEAPVVGEQAPAGAATAEEAIAAAGLEEDAATKPETPARTPTADQQAGNEPAEASVEASESVDSAAVAAAVPDDGADNKPVTGNTADMKTNGNDKVPSEPTNQEGGSDELARDKENGNEHGAASPILKVDT